MTTAYGNAPMKFIRLEAVAQVMNWTTGFKRSVNCWPNRNIPLAPANGRQQPATEATPALRGRLRRRTMNAASYNRAEQSIARFHRFGPATLEDDFQHSSAREARHT